MWYTTCGRHGHLPSKCPSILTTKGKKYSYCGGRGYDITTCWNISEVSLTVVTDNNNQSWPKKTTNKALYSVTSKQPFTRTNVGPPYKPGDGRP